MTHGNRPLRLNDWVPCQCPICLCVYQVRIIYDITQAQSPGQGTTYTRAEPLYTCSICYYGNHYFTRRPDH